MSKELSKREELQFAHKLRLKEIKLERLLGGLVTIVIAFGAGYFGNLVASDMRRDEIKAEAAQRVEEYRQEWILRRQLQGFTEVDSLLRRMGQSRHMYQLMIQSGDTATPDYRNRVLNDLFLLTQALEKHRASLPVALTTHLDNTAVLYRGLAYIDTGLVPKVENRLKLANYHAQYLMDSILMGRVDSNKWHDNTRGFHLNDAFSFSEIDATSPSGAVQYLITYSRKESMDNQDTTNSNID